MNPLAELNLTVILFFPWFVILSVLFWMVPRTPRPPLRIVFDIASLVIAVIAFILSVHWSMQAADTGYGRLWPQILATAVSYGVFLAVLASAFAVRAWWLRR